MTSNQLAKNNAETLLSAYFLKIKLTDVDIQKKTVNIFLPAITEIMRHDSRDWRSNAFKYLLTNVGMCISFYQQGERFFGKKVKDKKLIDDLCTKIFGSMSKLVIALLKDKVSRSSKVVDRILHSVFLDDLSCDMGVKIAEYRKLSIDEVKQKQKLKLEIESLLLDYNEINNTSLTFNNIINRGVKDENRRGD